MPLRGMGPPILIPGGSAALHAGIHILPLRGIGQAGLWPWLRAAAKAGRFGCWDAKKRFVDFSKCDFWEFSLFCSPTRIGS
jgi:hypothetical protein